MHKLIEYGINLKEQNAILHEVTFHVQTKNGKSQKFNVISEKIYCK